MSESHQREAAIFDAAMELPTGQRAAHLDHACGGDAALRQRIESLLKACESRCEFLDSPPDPGAAKTMNVLPASFEKAGDKIGRYKLLQQIGEGGCGVVYMAEQEEPASVVPLTPEKAAPSAADMLRVRADRVLAKVNDQAILLKDLVPSGETNRNRR